MKTSTSCPDCRWGTPKKIARVLVPLCVWVAVWWCISAWVGKELLVPSPWAVVKRLGELVQTPLFWRSTGLSLLRIFCGGVSGTVLGIFCGVLTSRFRWADWVLTPAIRVVRAAPVASFIILVLLWVRTGLVPGVISTLMVLPVVWQNISQGLASVDPQLLEMARAYELSLWRKLRYLYYPALRPYLISGVCTAIGLAWKSGVAAEVLCLPKAAIGTQVYYSKLYLDSPALFGWTIVVVLLSMGIERIIRAMLHRKGAREG